MKKAQIRMCEDYALVETEHKSMPVSASTKFDVYVRALFVVRLCGVVIHAFYRDRRGRIRQEIN
jgi:hypothetical protein